MSGKSCIWLGLSLECLQLLEISSINQNCISNKQRTQMSLRARYRQGAPDLLIERPGVVRWSVANVGNLDLYVPRLLEHFLSGK